MSAGVRAERGADESRRACRLVRFTKQWAPAIVRWVQSDQELFWLAPATAPPLTVEKVLAWLREDRHAYLLWLGEADQPIGYAELGLMPGEPSQMWLGHCLIAPSHRDRGFGRQFVGLLSRAARRRHAAGRLVLVVFPDNTAAIRCYQQEGFSMRGYERRYFETTGRRHRLLRMALDLQADQAGPDG
ncbi:MAG TPA: GNAT family N-acetyltransferase [Phycisphaerae bacterium]|nr:GNAT family N-acetyltransferase [Phycisphaerae bacterium]